MEKKTATPPEKRQTKETALKTGKEKSKKDNFFKKEKNQQEH